MRISRKEYKILKESYLKLKRQINYKPKSKHSKLSLKALYKRDKGICYLCGKGCNWDDYTIRGNKFIAGNYYPSIDHVIPLSKGGIDTWNNVRLSHRICNSLKSASE